MEQLPGAVGTMALILACVACWAGPARALYIYDAQPAGYVVAAGDDETYPNKLPAHRKYYTNPKNMKLVNEQAVDSYFKILRATPRSFPAATFKDRSPRPETRVTVITDAPKLRHKQKQPLEEAAYTLRSDPRDDKYSEKEKVMPGDNQFTKHNEEEISKHNGKDFRQHSVFDKNAIMAKGNKKTNRRPYRAQNFRHIMYLSQIRDKVLHKANLNGDSARARSRTDAFRPVSDKQLHSSKDNKKRNTGKDKESIVEAGEENDREIHSPNNRHANVQDRFQQPLRHNSPTKVQGYAAESEVGPPYALFYRMNHDPDMEHPAPLDTHDEGSYYRGSYLNLNTGRKHSSAML